MKYDGIKNGIKLKYEKFLKKGRKDKYRYSMLVSIFIIIYILLAYLGGDFLISEEELFGENVEGTIEIHYLRRFHLY